MEKLAKYKSFDKKVCDGLKINGIYPTPVKKFLIQRFPDRARAIELSFTLHGVRLHSKCMIDLRKLFGKAKADHQLHCIKIEQIESEIKNDHTSFLYVVSDGTAVKIGIAKDIENRISGIQTGNPRRIKLKALFKSETQGVTREVESTLHNLFKDRRLIGEWFDINEDEVVRSCSEFIKPLKKLNELDVQAVIATHKTIH